MNTGKLIDCLLDESQRLSSAAPTEASKHVEFIIKMTASTVITSFARALLNARKAGAV